MRNYELKIKDLNGIWHTADLGDEVPAMNYQVNDIAELKDRNADYSQQLKLPKSRTNKKIFGCLDTFEVLTEIPYKRLDCRLFLNDITIAGQGSYLIIDRVSESFEVHILSGNADVFEQMKNKDMSKIDLGYYVLGSVTSGNYYQSNDDYCLPEATFIKGGDDKLTPTRRYPFAYFINAIEKTINNNGFSLIHNVQSAVNRLAISVSNFNVGNMTFFSKMYFKGQPYPNGEIRIPAQSQQGGTITQRSEQYQSGDLETSTHWFTRYTANYDMTLNMNIVLDYYRYYSGISLFRVRKFSVTDILIHTYLYGEYNKLNQSFTIELEVGEYIEVDAFKDNLSFRPSVPPNIYPFPPHILIDVSFTSISINNYNKVENGDRLYISSNIGFEKQLDLLKAFTQLFGLIVFVDNVQKNIYAFTFDKIYENKSIAKNWSKKLHAYKITTSFKLEQYAQTNYISFHENTDDNVKDSISFVVNNENIEKSKVLFEIDFEAGIDNIINYTDPATKKVANIPIESVNDSEISFDGCMPHLVEISQVQAEDYLAYQANHIKLSSFILFYKKLYENMLNSAKIIEAEFYLTEKDIKEYRSVKNGMPGCFIPVYIEKFGAYFYINKIKNFISGKLTKVELIKL